MADRKERLGKHFWTHQEDALLSTLVKEFGAKRWRHIAAHLPNRSPLQCRDRWMNRINPDINKKPFTEAEDKTLMTLVQLYGSSWSVIAGKFPGRTDCAMKNRYFVLVRRGVAPVPSHPQKAKFMSSPNFAVAGTSKSSPGDLDDSESTCDSPSNVKELEDPTPPRKRQNSNNWPRITATSPPSTWSPLASHANSGALTNQNPMFPVTLSQLPIGPVSIHPSNQTFNKNIMIDCAEIRAPQPTQYRHSLLSQTDNFPTTSSKLPSMKMALLGMQFDAQAGQVQAQPTLHSLSSFPFPFPRSGDFGASSTTLKFDLVSKVLPSTGMQHPTSTSSFLFKTSQPVAATPVTVSFRDFVRAL